MDDFLASSNSVEEAESSSEKFLQGGPYRWSYVFDIEADEIL